MLSDFVIKNRAIFSFGLLSLVLYLIDYLYLGNSKEVVAGFLGNLAFLPVYVIFVMLIVEQKMRERELQAIKNKLNMVIGVFFSEVGNGLLKELSVYIVMCERFKEQLKVTDRWKDADYNAALKFLNENDTQIECEKCDLEQLKRMLVSKRGFLVGLLENQNLMEHDQVTEMLWAIFHLLEELEARPSFENMPRSDIAHLNNDIKRVFGYLSREWVLYMKHLKQDYPYLFSLAARMNPMLDNPNPHIY
jgi:hypothetical protein